MVVCVGAIACLQLYARGPTAWTWIKGMFGGGSAPPPTVLTCQEALSMATQLRPLIGESLFEQVCVGVIHATTAPLVARFHAKCEPTTRPDFHFYGPDNEELPPKPTKRPRTPAKGGR